MDCPQCGAEVPSDDAFCGKCGYARRDHAPERLDQSRIRVHEGPDPSSDQMTAESVAKRRARKHTVLGVAPGTPPVGFPAFPQPSPEPAPAKPATPAPSPPPTSISSARGSRERSRVPQKTMLGLQPPELISPPAEEEAAGQEAAGPGTSQELDREGSPSAETPSRRARARVRYDSANEPFPVIQRRKNVLRGLAVLVVLAAAWLAYRYVTLHG